MNENVVSERQVVECMQEILESSEFGELLVGEPQSEVRTRSFEESMMMTSNEGFVLRVNGQEFCVTVVRSR